MLKNLSTYMSLKLCHKNAELQLTTLKILSDTLRHHKLVHLNTSSVCYVCDCVFIDTSKAIGSRISMHLATNHKMLCTPTGTYKPEAERAFVCSICLQRFSSNKILALHTLKQHKIADSKMTQSCKICNTEHTSLHSLQIHLMSTQHRDMKIKIQSLFMCVDCRAIFPARDSYAMHMMMRAQSESCMSLESMAEQDDDVTSRASASPMSTRSIRASPAPRQDHASMRTNDVTGSSSQAERHAAKYPNINCQLCGLQFNHPSQLSMHMKVAHEALGDYVIMQQLVKRQADLQRTLSMRVNTGLWGCSICGTGFHSCDALAMHVMERHAIDVGTLADASKRRAAQEYALVAPKSQAPDTTTLNGSRSKDDIECQLPARLRRDDTTSTTTETEESKEITNRRHVTTPPQSVAEVEEPSPKRSKQTHSAEQPSGVMPTPSNSHNSPILCSRCGKSFDYKVDLLSHLKLCSVVENQSSPPRTCANCTQVFDKFSDYSRHQCQTADHDNADITHDQAVNSSTDQPTTFDDKIGALNESDMPTNEIADNGMEGEIEGITNGAPSRSPCLSDTQSKASLEKDEIIQALVEDAVAEKKSRKRSKINQQVPAEETTLLAKTDTMQHHLSVVGTAFNHSSSSSSELIAIPISPTSSPHLSEALPALELKNNGSDVSSLDATGHEHLEGEALLNFVVANNVHLIMCKYCHIIYTNRTMYYLHMGLHNLNKPWQCNLCGKECSNVHEFSSHVIHYR